MKFLTPDSTERACALMAEAAAGGRTLRPIAGATDLLVHWPSNHPAHDADYLDLSAVAELRPMRWTDSSLVLGAMTTYWDVLQDPRISAEFPLLVAAARQVGAVQIQSRGTWAGNIANGSPAADGVPVLMAYDAAVVVRSSSGSRTVPLGDFHTGYRRSVLRPDELIVAIDVPRRAGGYDFSVFHKVGPRRAQAITKVGVAVTRAAAQGSLGRWRIVANSVAPTVVRCRQTERLLESGRRIVSPRDFDQPLTTDVSPIDDIRSTAAYRRTVLGRLLYHSLVGVCPSVV